MRVEVEVEQEGKLAPRCYCQYHYYTVRLLRLLRPPLRGTPRAASATALRTQVVALEHDAADDRRSP